MQTTKTVSKKSIAWSWIPPWEITKYLKYREVAEKTIPLSKVVFSEGKISVEKRVEVIEEKVSDAHSFISKFSRSYPAMPKWVYEDVPNAVLIGDVVNKLANFLSEFSPSTEDFTKPGFLNKPFRLAKQLLQAQTLGVEFITFTNGSGGVDIYARVDSASSNEKRAVIISVTKGKDGKAVVNGVCSCPVGHLMCKHQMAVLLATLPVVLAAVEAIERGGEVRDYLPKWEKKYNKLLDWVNNCPGNGCGSAVAYYITKFLKKTGRYSTWRGVPPDELYDAVGRAITYGRPPFESVIKKEVERYKGEEPIVTGKEMVYNDVAVKAREVVIKMVLDLSRRLGYSLPVMKKDAWLAPDWVHLLVFGNIKGADYSEPPVVVGAIGDPGTGKTMGFKLSQLYFEAPYVKLVYRARSPDHKKELSSAYRKVLETLEKYGFIAPGDFAGKYGGLIHHVSTSGDTLTVMLDMTILATYPFPSLKMERDKAIELLVSELRTAGFSVSMVRAVPEAAIVDKGVLAMFGALSTKTSVDPVLGYLNYNQYLGMNRAVLLDEATRDVRGLDNLLTQTSVRTIDTAASTFGITSNVEPFMDMVRDPRSEAIRDRTYFTSMPTKVDPEMRAKYIHSKPEVRIDTVVAASIWRVIKGVPVPDYARILIRTIRYSLMYKFLSIQIAGGSFLLPTRRGKYVSEEAEVIDVFANLGKEFGFLGGLRFDAQTEDLAKYFAFVAGRPKVSTEDVIRALESTVQARINYQARSVEDMRIFVTAILNKIRSLTNEIGAATEKVIPLIDALRNHEYSKAEKIFLSLIDDARANPLVGVATVSAIRLFLEENPEVDIDSLPEPIALTAIGVLVDEGNLAEISKTSAFSKFYAIAGMTVFGVGGGK